MVKVDMATRLHLAALYITPEGKVQLVTCLLL